MKNLSLLLIIFCLVSCKQEEKKEVAPTKLLTIAEKIANAHGFKNWANVKSFAFTFGGNYEESNSGRSWIWNPKTNDVSLTRGEETNSYNRNSMDSISIKSDRAFINDKFWALFPFQLVWDEGTTISEPTKELAPISKKELNKIVLLYGSKGGYTPGDAYDIYYDNDFIIREWAFRKGNADEAALVNTFEKYENFGGLKIAQEHKKEEGDWNLLVWKIKVELDQ